MLLRLTFFFLFALLCTNSRAQVSFGEATLLDDGWRFLRVDSAWNIVESPDMAQPSYDDTRWRQVQLPHDWGIELPMSPDKASCQGYLPGGIGWYRRLLHIPPSEESGASIASSSPLLPEGGGAKQKFFLYFEGAYSHAEVFVNGERAGHRPSGFASFLCDITPHLRPDGQNMVAVRVDHSEEADARWYTGSGINRHVWLIRSPQIHLAQWGTAYRLQSISRGKAIVEVDVETTDERLTRTPVQLSAVVELADADGRIVATTRTPIGTQEKKTVRLSVKNPQRWSLDKPYLYTLHTRLLNGGTDATPAAVCDSSTVKAGLRTLQFSPDRGFALNGQWIKVKGVCLHDDAGALGTAVPREVWRQRLTELKRIGTNAIRMSHNPHMPELYDLCDELGLLVMDEASDEWEFPKRKWLKGWNQGAPGYQGTYTFFEEWIERDVADMVRRDRCHPSVFLWSIGNEVDYPNDPYSHPVLDGGTGGFTQPMYGGYKPGQPHAERIGHIAQRLAAVVRGIDTSRPVTGALAGVVMSNATAYPEAVDVVGYNYTESRYDEDHARYPKRVIYGSENRHDLPAWQAVEQNDHIFGQFLWTGIDYLGEAGIWPARGSSAGLLDLKGERKPIGWYRAALWSEEPVCYIGSYPLALQSANDGNYVSSWAPDVWSYDEGQRVRVVCYTNAASASLTLNGMPVGGEAKRDSATAILYWDLNYQPGTLRCQAANGASYELYTCRQPQGLRITVGERKAGERVSIVTIEAVDGDGRTAYLADCEVALHLEGPARLLGMENGNIMQVPPVRRAPHYRAPSRLRLHGGRLVAYILAEEAHAPIKVRATAPLLQSAELTL